jgi:hypothetical protein
MAFTEMLRSFLTNNGYTGVTMREDGSGVTMQKGDRYVDITASENGDSVLMTGHLGELPEDIILRMRLYDGLMLAQGVNLAKPYLSFAVKEHEGLELVAVYRSLAITPMLEQIQFDEVLNQFMEDYQALYEQGLADFMMIVPDAAKAAPSPTTFTDLS